MPRTKAIVMDGASFTIAPLTVSQVEEFISRQRALLAKKDAVGMRDTWRDLICMGLNNAGGEWKKEELDTTLDIPLFNFLRDEILKFSGLASDNEEKKIPEVAAAATS